MFKITQLKGGHQYLVQEPMWESLRDVLDYYPTHRFSESLLKEALKHVLLALDYLHTECKLIHTGITPRLVRSIANSKTNITDNRHQRRQHSPENQDLSILESFTKAELEHPSPRQNFNGMPVYASRRPERPEIFGESVLSDFGSTVSRGVEQDHDAQPNVYRCPEVMLQMGQGTKHRRILWRWLGCLVLHP